MRINYVSNLPRDLRSGGFSAMNFAAASAVETAHDVRYVGPVNPPVSLPAKALSKAMRLAGRPGDYAFFSRGRLERIAAEVEAGRAAADLDFFHGFTPWVLTPTDRPYVAWSDCTFPDYMEFFHDRAAFRPADLARVEQSEAAWLRGAHAVGFSSRWAADRAIQRYGLDSARVAVLGIFGDFEPPQADLYDGAKQFAFISTNFARKGGHDVLAAFRKVRAADPEATLLIVGDGAAMAEPGVTHAGFLRKENTEEYARLRAIFATSRAIVNATRSDTAPVLLVEAGYFGCPVISARRFAIPEIVEDGKTGILVDDPSDHDALADAMTWMLRADEDYARMRRAAWDRTRAAHTTAIFEARLLAFIEEAGR